MGHHIPHTEEAKRKIALSHKGKKRPPFSEEWKKNMGLSARKNRGERHWNWQGGLTKLTVNIHRLPEYIDWRTKIFKRDGYTCQICGKKGCELNVDHITPLSILLSVNNIMTPEQAIACLDLWDIMNGRTLCVACHRNTDTYGVNARVLKKRLLTNF